MNFLEKDLETIIWENYAACERRGLLIDYEAGFQYGLKFRQLNLMPFGIADLVNIYYDPFRKICKAQVIECKKHRIDAATYLQAKRYGSAISDLFFKADIDVDFVLSYVLVGAELNNDGELAHVIAQDTSCKSFIYKYAVDGIAFHDVTRQWGYSTTSIGSEREIAGRDDIRQHVVAGRKWMHETTLEKGDYQSPLLVTPDGVLLNTWLTDFDTYGPAH